MHSCNFKSPYSICDSPLFKKMVILYSWRTSSLIGLFKNANVNLLEEFCQFLNRASCFPTFYSVANLSLLSSPL